MILLVVQLLLVLLYPSVHAGIEEACGLNCAKEQVPRPKRHFYIYWNVPTFMCHKYDLYFNEVHKFHILQNKGDKFHGDIIGILYDPGEFPAMVPVDENNNPVKYKRRNGGVPQMGNFNRHKVEFKKILEQQLPDNITGIGVIDFEKWKPIFRQNWGNQKIHKDMSIDLVRKVHPSWNPAIIEDVARSKFEKYARYFMEETLNLAKQARIKADWGYYGYPYCYNLPPGTPVNETKKARDCDSKVMKENDKMSWLFKNQAVLLPSVYLRYFLKPEQRVDLVAGRVAEASRISNNLKQLPRVIPFWWYKYSDQTDVFLSEKDVRSTFRAILDNGGEGIIIWGSSRDVDTKLKCKGLKKYVETILGPIADEILKIANTGFPFNF